MKSLIIALTLITSSAFAAGTNVKMLTNMDKLDAKCPGLKITKEQKIDITKVIVEMKKAAMPMRKDLKVAKKAKRKVMMDTSTTKEEAMVAMKEFRTAKRPLSKLRKTAMLNVQFDILTGEQRVKLPKCKKKGRRGHGRRGGN